LLNYSKSFIEVQFPVSRVSKESYKERKANLGQTLTGLGKWWGRKPLIMVRAALLGVLLPVSDNHTKDRKIFLKIMTMDKEGLWLRKYKNLSKKKLWELTTDEERKKYFREGSTTDKPEYPTGMSSKDKNKMKEEIQKLAFNRLSYDEKLSYCRRPEEVELTDEKAWEEINKHLETSASNIQELIRELGKKRFGHVPKVGDCFSGGGSIPFEAARMGADVFGSDLNPIAVLLTWASINIAGSSDKEVNNLKEFQQRVYESVDKQITEWNIEHNEEGHRADSYLYCNETKCPECGFDVPLAPSWVIGKGTRTVAIIKENEENKIFDIDIIQEASKEEIKKANNLSTIEGNKIICPHCKSKTPITSIRKDNKTDNGTMYGLNLWEKNKFMSDGNDVFKERLYAIRYVNKNGNRYYTAPKKGDLTREHKIIELLSERFKDWQEKGYLPFEEIKEGDKTDEPIRTRGWKYWHQLFNPRQLLLNGLFFEEVVKNAKNEKEFVIGLLGINRVINHSSKLCIWHNGGHVENSQSIFVNQALNPIYNYGARATTNILSTWLIEIKKSIINEQKDIKIKDAREVRSVNDIWISDPPYADAVNYHELSEFFLAWDKKLLKKAFPEWYSDSKRVLAVKGTGQSFNESMIEIYKNLADNMPDNGYQVVMFTHQDVKVWSELTMILWSAGLKVASAWNISTETNSGGLKEGNYVKGTVLLVLRKQTSDDFAFQDEVYDEIQIEVKKMIDSMKGIDYKDLPDFSDADYLLASNAAALKVMTGYGEIDGIDVEYWLAGDRDEESPVEKLIKKARDVANKYLIPNEFEKNHWLELSNSERYFIRGLELEMNNEHTIGAYQELAKGFGVKDYKNMFHNYEANNVRLKSPSEFKISFLDNEFNNNHFNGSLIRHLLVALYETTKNNSTASGLTYLKGVFNQSKEYWHKKPLMNEILTFISKIEMVDHMEHWHEEAKYAKLLREALKNEGV